MNCLLTALFSLILVLPAGKVVQLCKHESGPIHVFVDNSCDGTFSHSRSLHGNTSGHRYSHYHHGHNHSDEHSQHSSPGEHHEPCTHEIISSGDNLIKVYAAVTITLKLSVILLPVEQWNFDIAAQSNTILLGEPQTRGPPGTNDPFRQFASCIRLTI